MDIVILIICLIISGVFPAALYIIFPILLMYTLSLRSSITINSLTKLYIYIVIIVLSYLFLHIIINKELKYIFIKGFLRYFSYMAFCIYLASLSKNIFIQFFKIISLFFFLTLPLAIYQLNSVERYQNIFMHANHFAYILAICLYFIFKNKIFGNANFLVIIMLLFSLILTSTSGALLLIIILLLYHYISKSKKLFAKFIYTSTFFLLVLIGLSFSTKIVSQIDSLEYLDWDFIISKAQTYEPGGYGSFIWRVIYWVQILLAFLDNNTIIILFGEGIDTLTKNNYLYSFMYTDPHNDFLKIFVEFGALGLLLLLMFFLKIYRIFHRNLDYVIILAVPLFFDNMVVNWSYNMCILLFMMYYLKDIIEIKQNEKNITKLSK